MTSCILKNSIWGYFSYIYQSSGCIQIGQHSISFSPCSHSQWLLANTLSEVFEIIQMYLDLNKAFDTVKHGILLHKLLHYRVRGHPLNLFTVNHIYVIGTNLCAPITLTIRKNRAWWNPGSILGPLLFIIYINDKLLNLTLPEDKTNRHNSS